MLDNRTNVSRIRMYNQWSNLTHSYNN